MSENICDHMEREKNQATKIGELLNPKYVAKMRI
jgi:hypothetical protein